MLHTAKQLDALEDALLALDPSQSGMSASQFDGFVAALLVCPELIQPGEWLGVVSGTPKALSPLQGDEFQGGIEQIMMHYNRVARGLARRRPVHNPVYLIDSNSEDVLWEVWVDGFERGMRLRPDAWITCVESGDKEVDFAVSLMLTLHEIDHGTCDLSQAQIDELTQMAPEFIPSLVLCLNGFAKSLSTQKVDRRAKASASPSKMDAKIGRNVPCPCGSGRKYKRCCGAATPH